jgi:hypothetical protein
MSLFRRLGARVPLSDRDLARQCYTALQELKRARALGMDTRELWFEEQMNQALDVLCERRRLRSTACPA